MTYGWNVVVGEVYTNGSNFRKIVKKFELDGKNYLVYQVGSFIDDKFTASTYNTPRVKAVESWEEEYNKYSPSRFKKGDLLTDGKGRLFVYESDTYVWAPMDRTASWADDNGMYWSTLASREKDGKLRKVTAGSGTREFGTVTLAPGAGLS